MTPPSNGQIKINVDDSFLDGSGRGGIEEEFRDLEGKVLLQFSMEVSVYLAVHAEFFVF